MFIAGIACFMAICLRKVGNNMSQNIFVCIMCIIVFAAVIFAWWLDHRSYDENSQENKEKENNNEKN